MKKIILAILFLILSFALSSCGSNEEVTNLEDFSSHVEATGDYDYGYILIDDISYLYDYDTGYASVANSTYNAIDVVIKDNITVNDTVFPVKVIGDGAFSICISLRSVVIGKNITEIGKEAFINSFYLTSITIPSNVNVCKYNLFANCNADLKIYVEENEIPNGFDSEWCLNYTPILS